GIGRLLPVPRCDGPEVAGHVHAEYTVLREVALAAHGDRVVTRAVVAQTRRQFVGGVTLEPGALQLASTGGDKPLLHQRRPSTLRARIVLDRLSMLDGEPLGPQVFERVVWSLARRRDVQYLPHLSVAAFDEARATVVLRWDDPA